jgi:hypothetical protein
VYDFKAAQLAKEVTTARHVPTGGTPVAPRQPTAPEFKTARSVHAARESRLLTVEKNPGPRLVDNQVRTRLMHDVELNPGPSASVAQERAKITARVMADPKIPAADRQKEINARIAQANATKLLADDHKKHQATSRAMGKVMVETAGKTGISEAQFGKMFHDFMLKHGFMKATHPALHNWDKVSAIAAGHAHAAASPLAPVMNATSNGDPSQVVRYHDEAVLQYNIPTGKDAWFFFCPFDQDRIWYWIGPVNQFDFGGGLLPLNAIASTFWDNDDTATEIATGGDSQYGVPAFLQTNFFLGTQESATLPDSFPLGIPESSTSLGASGTGGTVRPIVTQPFPKQFLNVPVQLTAADVEFKVTAPTLSDTCTVLWVDRGPDMAFLMDVRKLQLTTLFTQAVLSSEVPQEYGAQIDVNQVSTNQAQVIDCNNWITTLQDFSPTVTPVAAGPLHPSLWHYLAEHGAQIEQVAATKSHAIKMNTGPACMQWINANSSANYPALALGELMPREPFYSTGSDPVQQQIVNYALGYDDNVVVGASPAGISVPVQVLQNWLGLLGGLIAIRNTGSGSVFVEMSHRTSWGVRPPDQLESLEYSPPAPLPPGYYPPIPSSGSGGTDSAAKSEFVNNVKAVLQDTGMPIVSKLLARVTSGAVNTGRQLASAVFAKASTAARKYAGDAIAGAIGRYAPSFISELGVAPEDILACM